ncbi:MAG: ATP-dependent helicase [Propionibacteriaceae bacterium]|jgi:DNA helicase-2/ATP-dependent DNA helicase PcrA|nr:ATP-dependent helicase [Propionibacteriaceae bacterium]
MKTLTHIQQLSELMKIPFSEEQAEAITSPMAPSVIIAGAGTGKTTVMAARVVWLVGTGAITPERVLGLTFTRKAAAELAMRITSALDLLKDDDDSQFGVPTISTYDAFASTVVSQFGFWMGRSRDSRIITGGEQYLLADEVLRCIQEPPGTLANKSWDSVVTNIPRLESRIQSHLVDDDQILQYTLRFMEGLDSAPRNRHGNVYVSIREAQTIAEERLALLRLCQEYRELKVKQGVLEFGDQMALAVKLAGTLPIVGEDLRERFGLVVVDEYQDTSPAQARLLSAIFGHEAGIEGYPITAVGDPLQAIYTWRGAAVDNIFSFHESFPCAQPIITTLSINRRSGPQILDVANHISAGVRADPLLGGRTTVELQPSVDTSDAQVTIRQFYTWDEEAEWIAESIAGSGESGQIEQWSHIAILVRRHREVGALVEACGRHQIPVEVQDLGGLILVESISQVMAMMTLLTDIRANPEVVEILAGPRFRLSTADLESLGRRARDLAKQQAQESPYEERLFDAVANPGQTGFSEHALHSFELLVHDIESLKSSYGTVLDQVRRIVAQIGLDTEICAHGTHAHLDGFLDIVASFSQVHPGASLASLLGYIRAEEEYSHGFAKAGSSQHDAVKIMTIHHAKGLEWETVYLPCLTQGVFPGERLTDNPIRSACALSTALRSDWPAMPQISQITNAGLITHGDDLKQALRMGEDRLAYVAVTRAKSTLVMTSHLWRSEALSQRTPSHYFEQACEVGSSKVHRVDPSSDEGRTPRPHRREAVAWPEEGNLILSDARDAVRRAMDSIVTWESGDLPREVVTQIESWDEMILILDSEVSQDRVIDVPLPAPLSASQLVRLREDSEAFVQALTRPMPRPPSQAARRGTLFHQWVEQYYSSSPLVVQESIPGDITTLCTHFLTSPFSLGRPMRVEEEFVTTIAGHAITGRIDAVFAAQENPELVPPGKAVLIVDWKTGFGHADPQQLAVYARAWAAMKNIDTHKVAAGFFFAATGQFVDVDLDVDSIDEWVDAICP